MTNRRLLVAVVGAITFAGCGIVFHHPAPALVRLALLGATLGAIVESDLAERRIPNPIVLPAAAACAAASVSSGIDVSALATGLALVAALLALSLVRQEALGMGDVKLALLLVLGLDGRGTTAVLVAFALAATFGGVLFVRFGRAAGERTLPLAPFFAAGALIALIA